LFPGLLDFAELPLNLANLIARVLELIGHLCLRVGSHLAGNLGGVLDGFLQGGGDAVEALGNTFGKPVAFIREGGSIPITQSFKDVLGIDTLLLGLALPDCKAHSPNENFSIENFYAGIRLNQYLLDEIADIDFFLPQTLPESFPEGTSLLGIGVA